MVIQLHTNKKVFSHLHCQLYNYSNKDPIFKKEVGIIIIVRKQVATYVAMKLLATHSKSSMILVTICVCSCKHNSSWVVTSMHAQMKHIL